MTTPGRDNSVQLDDLDVPFARPGSIVHAGHASGSRGPFGPAEFSHGGTDQPLSASPGAVAGGFSHPAAASSTVAVSGPVAGGFSHLPLAQRTTAPEHFAAAQPARFSDAATDAPLPSLPARSTVLNASQFSHSEPDSPTARSIGPTTPHFSHGGGPTPPTAAPPSPSTSQPVPSAPSRPPMPVPPAPSSPPVPSTPPAVASGTPHPALGPQFAFKIALARGAKKAAAAQARAGSPPTTHVRSTTGWQRS
jgi:hypothetical protein